MIAHLAAVVLTAAAVGSGWAMHAIVLTRRLTAARHDPLSGLLTRDGWTRQARRIVRSPRSVVLLCDLDGFKPINDRFGHSAGDAVLAATGNRLATWCDTGGLAGRFGGDEFVAILPDDAHLPQRVAELHALLRQPVNIGDRTVQVSASIGVARLADFEDPSLSAALGAADGEMYRHKGRGRRGRRLSTPSGAAEHDIVAALVG
jgi:diguanylate cyclase (GGDEF)-like protein